MDNKYGLIGVVLTVLIGVILIGSVMAPSITAIQKTAGDEVTVTNSTITDNFNYKKWTGEETIISYTGGNLSTTGEYTINGESSGLTFSSVQRIVLASDEFSIRTGGSSSTGPILLIQTIYANNNIQGTAFTFTVSTDGTYTLTYASNEYTGTITWMVYATADGTLNLGQMPLNSESFYTSPRNDIIILGSVYITGENDTFYSYYNGDLTVAPDYADVSSIDISTSPAEGYIDIYDTTVTLTIGDESFTPYYILAPIDVTGLEEGGAAYTLYGIIIVLFIIVLFVASVRLFLREKD